MPWHVALDGARERRLGKLQIGTTRRGIGPAYADKATRIGIRVQDLLDPKILRQKIELAVDREERLARARLRARRRSTLEEVVAAYAAHARAARAVRRRHVAARRPRAPRRAAGALRGRAGDAARPRSRHVSRSSRRPARSRRAPRSASASGRSGSTRCSASRRRTSRASARGRSRARSRAPAQARVRELGGEFGTVTGRERRCGWLDLVALRFAVRVNGITSLALTKLDVLSAFDEIPVCVRYRLPDGSETDDFPAHQSDFHHCAPVFETLAGWRTRARRRRRCPPRRAATSRFVEDALGVPVDLVGTGAAREPRAHDSGVARGARPRRRLGRTGACARLEARAVALAERGARRAGEPRDRRRSATCHPVARRRRGGAARPRDGRSAPTSS